MKKILTITTAILLCIFIAVYILNIGLRSVDIDLLTILGAGSSVMQEEETQEVYRHYFEKLNKKEKWAYVRIYKSLESHPERINIPKLSDVELSRVFEAVSYDNPHMLCLGTTCRTSSKGWLSYFKTDYSASEELCLQRTQELEEKVTSILGMMPGSLSEYEKELFIHDYIINNCSYYNGEDAGMVHTAYGALVEGYASCEGYSRAAQLLFNRVGIKNHLVTGQAVNVTGSVEGHMWNLVTIGGQNYHLDVTWDDPIAQGQLSPSYVYFNVTDDAISVNHFDYDRKETNCNAIDANYFYVNGLLFNRYDDTARTGIVNLLSICLNSGSNTAEFRFTNQDAYQIAVKDLFTNGRIYRLIALANLSSNSNGFNDSAINYSVDKDNFTIRLFPSYK